MLFSVEMIRKMVKNGTRVILDEPIKYANSKANVISQGVELNERSVSTMENMNIQHAKVLLSEEDLARYELDCEIIPTVENTISNKAKLTMGDLLEKHKFDEKTVGNVLTNAKVLVDAIDVVNLDFKTSLTERFLQETNKDRAVRVATFATVLGHEYNKTHISKIDLNQLAAATLFSFAGEACENDSIRAGLKNVVSPSPLYKKLDKDTLESIQTTYNEEYVPVYSRNLLEFSTEPTLNLATFKQSVLLSGEDMLGTGPLGFELKAVENSKSNISAMIISLANIFDKSIAFDIQHNVTLENTLTTLQGILLKGLYDRELVKLIIAAIPLYPIRTKVEIFGENGYEYAYVIDNHKDDIKHILDIAGLKEEDYALTMACMMYSRPVIRTVPGNQEIDLSSSKKCAITKVIGTEIKYSDLQDQSIHNSPIQKAM